MQIHRCRRSELFHSGKFEREISHEIVDSWTPCMQTGIHLFVAGHLLSIPHCEPDKSDPRFLGTGQVMAET